MADEIAARFPNLRELDTDDAGTLASYAKSLRQGLSACVSHQRQALHIGSSDGRNRKLLFHPLAALRQV